MKVGIGNLYGSSYNASRQGEYFHKEVSMANGSSLAAGFVRTESTYQGNTEFAYGNQVVPETPEARQYNSEGQLTQDGRWNYEWNGGRLERMTLRFPNIDWGAEKIEFEYDDLGRRVGKYSYEQMNGPIYIRTLYVWHGWNLVAEFQDPITDIAWSKQFVWGTDLSGSLQGAGGVGGLLKVQYGNWIDARKEFVVSDGNGNVTGMCDVSTGQWITKYEYGPFGEPLRLKGPYSIYSYQTNVNPFGFSSKYRDVETGLLYYGMRYYNPTTGRWISRDPIGERGGLNLYGFVGNDPIRKLDPIGLAYFAYRPLGGFLGFLGVFGGDEPADDNLNTVIGHEQLFFEDGGEPANIGFFSDTTLREEGEPELSKYREPHDTGWNDCVMRNAILLTKHSSYCLLGKPGPTEKFNCQDWADAVRETYRRLIKSPTILKECCPTKAEREK